MNDKLILTISWFAVVIWIALIFSFSAQPAEESSKLSSGILESFVSVVESTGINILSFIDYDSLHTLLRKGAHFSLYFVLGLLVFNAMKISGIELKKSIYLTIFFCLAIGSLDEFYQTFVPGRSGEISDVVIDGVGSLFGIVFYILLSNIKKDFLIINKLKINKKN